MVCPGTQRYVDQGSGTTPGLAAEAYAAVKVAKYADQDNFIPFILPKTSRSGGQALARIQAYMLADIVVAIPAVDLAIEAVV